jgi:hypothetical protein
MTLWDSMVDVWSILAGVLQAPSRVVEELRRAASVLLHGIAIGEIAGNGYRGTESLTRDLMALGGTCAEGEEIATQHGGLEKLKAQVFGARKRVLESAGLPPWVLPKPMYLPASMDVPQSTVRQLVNWAFGRKEIVEVIEGPFAGESLTDWPLDQLQMADAEFAENVTRLRLLLRNGHRMNVRVWPGYEEPRDGGVQCLSAGSGCEQQCPFFGESICPKYVIGIGWSLGDAVVDKRKFTGQPSWKKDLQPSRATDVGHQKSLSAVAV